MFGYHSLHCVLCVWLRCCCIRGLYSVCHQPLVYNAFYDGSVNDAELEATYNNVMATMDNQVVSTGCSFSILPWCCLLCLTYVQGKALLSQ
jgi:hypothetical protein